MAATVNCHSEGQCNINTGILGCMPHLDELLQVFIIDYNNTSTLKKKIVINSTLLTAT